MQPSPRPSGFDRGRTLFLVGLVLGLFASLVLERLLLSEEDRAFEFVRTVRDLVDETYVAEADPNELAENALRGMLAGLDRYSRFYGKAEVASLQRETSGEFRGIGVVFRPPTTEGVVLFPFPDAPADRAGMRVGDRLVEIDGAVVAELGPGGLQRSLQAADGELDVRVTGLDGEERELVIRPERVIDPTVRHARLLDATLGVGYVAIVSFSHKTPEEFDRAIAELEPQGLRGLVLDLRSNPGGILEAAERIANRFIQEGTIVATKTRHQTYETKADPDEATLAELPLVVLIDGGSASSSEVLAGALQDHRRAVLVGEASYGKGTVQTLTTFDGDRAIVKLTTATYYTPAWKRIERNGEGEDEHGIAPDVQIELADEKRAEIYRHLASYSPPHGVLPALLRWEAEEQAELVPRHPEDPQLEVALDLFRGQPLDPGRYEVSRAR